MCVCVFVCVFSHANIHAHMFVSTCVHVCVCTCVHWNRPKKKSKLGGGGLMFLLTTAQINPLIHNWLPLFLTGGDGVWLGRWQKSIAGEADTTWPEQSSPAPRTNHSKWRQCMFSKVMEQLKEGNSLDASDCPQDYTLQTLPSGSSCPGLTQRWAVSAMLGRHWTILDETGHGGSQGQKQADHCSSHEIERKAVFSAIDSIP